MAIFNKLRIKPLTLGDIPQPKIWSYDGETANVNGSTDTLTVLQAKATGTWTTTPTFPNFQVSDTVKVKCTDGAVDLLCTAFNTTTLLATFQSVDTTATT